MKNLKEDRSKWFVAVGEKPAGPMTAQEIYNGIINNQYGWAHFIWCEGMKEWQRACDVPPFSKLAPGAPPAPGHQAPVIKQVKKTVAGKREWFLHYNETQHGPFSEDEIQDFLKSGKINSRVHAWKHGMENWTRLEKVFKDSPPSEKKSSSDRRSSMRKPLVAKIMMAHEDSVIMGICRDISIGGMQVLTDQIPGKVGTKLKLNISPSGKDKFDPFVAKGVIVRVLEDGRGFSFRFDGLSESAQKTVKKYLGN